MRELKFRAWDKKNNRWYKTELEYYGFHIWGECTLLTPPHPSDLPNLEITQFIGIRDIRGKDIYEHDIIDFGEFTLKRVVVYEDRSPGFWLCPLTNFIIKDFSALLSADFCRGKRIIGNIYENPELMKEEHHE